MESVIPPTDRSFVRKAGIEESAGAIFWKFEIVTKSVRNSVGCFVVGRFIVAGGAARFAIHQAVQTNPYIDYGLAKAAELFALASAFGLLTLRAMDFRGAGSGAHGS